MESASEVRQCACCLTTFPRQGKKRFCSTLCCDVFRGHLTIGPEGYVITCAVCGKRGAVARPIMKACYRCTPEWNRRRKAAWKVENPEKYREQVRRRTYKKRPYTDPKVRAAVFARNGYVCQLCGGPTRPDLKFPARASPVIDHIVPLSWGGWNVIENFQTAHHYCNSLKQAMSGTEFERRYVLPLRPDPAL